jgi:dipeptidyl-peptidase-4
VRSLLLCLLLLSPCLAQKKPVTVEVAAREARRPPSPVWSHDGARFIVQREKKLFVHTVSSPDGQEFLDLASLESQAASAPPERAPFHWTNRNVREQPIQWAPDSSFLLISAKGDLFRFDWETGRTGQLTKTPATEHDPKLSPDGKHASFRRDNDLYVINLATGQETRLTRDGSATVINAGLDWVYPEELGLSTAHWWSPDSARIAYLQFDVSPVMLYPHADLLGTRPLAEPQRFPQAGTPNSNVRLGVVAVSGGPTEWFDLGEPPDGLLARVTWMPDASALAVHRLTRVQDRLDVLLFDLSTGRSRILVTESAKTWINLKDDFRFLSKSAELIWGSERSGFRHLYLVSRNGSGAARALTSGEWEITDLHCVDEESGAVYFSATAESPLERHLYRVRLRGGKPERLTREAGTHSVSMSPGCRYYLDTWSSLTEPPQSILAAARGELRTVIEAQDRKLSEEYEILPTEIVEFRGAGGARFYARLLKPAGFEPSKKYPAVIQVYGGPHAQSVRNMWRGADWDQVLAHRGFVVWQMDNRGTAFRGHEWEAPLYRRFGKQELADQLEGIRYLLNLGFVDAKRIGINGWSYGGFMTLYSMLNSPDTFRAGIAGAPVTDWLNYDTLYTERYLGLPCDNEEGYRASSPVHQAANLKGSLLLVHNFEDDNVLFQHTVRMAEALQRADKEFEMMIYPQKAHGVTGQFRRHLLQTLTGFFERRLK